MFCKTYHPPPPIFEALRQSPPGPTPFLSLGSQCASGAWGRSEAKPPVKSTRIPNPQKPSKEKPGFSQKPGFCRLTSNQSQHLSMPNRLHFFNGAAATPIIIQRQAGHRASESRHVPLDFHQHHRHPMPNRPLLTAQPAAHTVTLIEAYSYRLLKGVATPRAPAFTVAPFTPCVWSHAAKAISAVPTKPGFGT